MRLVAQTLQPNQGARPRLIAALLRKGGDIYASGIETKVTHPMILGRASFQPDAPVPMGQSATMHTTPPLILASTSIYRRELLSRLRIPFDVVAPEVDEAAHADEPPAQLATRLALAKARAVARQHPDAVVVGSDQVAELDGAALGKPGDHERATQQLRSMRGRPVIFHTAVAVVRAGRGFEDSDLACVRVTFRDLGDAEIERYLRAEQPYDCAGSAKSEALGIALLQAVESDDPTALIGLPLIRTCALLRRAGLDPLGAVDQGIVP
jgi:septum formation protein